MILDTTTYPNENGVQHPYAYDLLTKELTHISRSNLRSRYQCVGCEGRMIAVHGTRVRSHFRHKATACTAETAQHKMAKAIISQSWHAAKAGRAPFLYPVKLQCNDCGEDNNKRYELVEFQEAQLKCERSIVKGTRSDIVIDNSAVSRHLRIRNAVDEYIIIEIIVSHAPSEQTREAYEKAGFPVFLVKAPPMNEMATLADGLQAYESINVKGVLCGLCAYGRKPREYTGMTLRGTEPCGNCGRWHGGQFVMEERFGTLCEPCYLFLSKRSWV